MKVLVVEDDFISRNFLQKLLGKFGACDVAVNGEEALVAFNHAHSEKAPYDLICLDIMMPEMDGQETLKRLRAIEEGLGIGGLAGVKIIMTTALGDKTTVLNCFKNGCEAYLVKPIMKDKLIAKMQELGLQFSVPAR